MRGIIAEFRGPVDICPLGRYLPRNAEVTIKFEEIIPTEEGPAPFFWISGDDRSAVIEALNESEEIGEFEVVASFDQTDLCHLDWSDLDQTVFNAIFRAEATLLSAIGTGDGWALILRSSNRSNLSRFLEDCERRGITLELQHIHSVTDESLESKYGLTDAQLEALSTAFEIGYFDHPRESSLTTLGEKLGISHQAAGARLQRGIRNLIISTIGAHEHA